jgi:hypothetical protein
VRLRREYFGCRNRATSATPLCVEYHKYKGKPTDSRLRTLFDNPKNRAMNAILAACLGHAKEHAILSEDKTAARNGAVSCVCAETMEDALSPIGTACRRRGQLEKSAPASLVSTRNGCAKYVSCRIEKQVTGRCTSIACCHSLRPTSIIDVAARPSEIVENVLGPWVACHRRRH